MTANTNNTALEALRDEIETMLIELGFKKSTRVPRTYIAKPESGGHLIVRTKTRNLRVTIRYHYVEAPLLNMALKILTVATAKQKVESFLNA
jgi:hypothetical protein